LRIGQDVKVHSLANLQEKYEVAGLDELDVRDCECFRHEDLVSILAKIKRKGNGNFKYFNQSLVGLVEKTIGKLALKERKRPTAP
jgi:hypothetical protein